MDDFVNIEIPKYYYWEGDTPTLPQTDTLVSYKLVGPDSTTIKISSGFAIDNTTNGFKISGKRASSNLLFTFDPANTSVSDGITKITTKNSTVYEFKGESSGSKSYKVNRGRVIITESIQQSLLSGTKSTIDVIDVAKDTYVKNTIAQSEFLKTDAIYTSSSTMDKLTRLLFLFINDLLTISIISFFVIAILLIVKVDGDSLYPCNIKQSPYVSTTYDKDLSIITKDGGFCAQSLEVQKRPDISDDDKPVIEIFNKFIMDKTNLYPFSTILQDKCKDTTNSSGAFTVLVYWMLYLIFNVFLMIQKALNIMHKGLKMVGSSYVYFSFTILLVIFFLLVQNISKGVLHPYFKYNGEYKDFDVGSFVDTNSNSGRDIENIFIMMGINILALIIIVAIPLFLILSAASIYGNVSSLITLIVGSSSVECMFLSFFAFVCSINFVLKLLPDDLDPTKIKMENDMSSLTKQSIDFIFQMLRLIRLPDLNGSSVFMFFVNIFNFLGSIFGVFLPFAMALAASLYISTMVVASTFILPFKVKNIWESILTPAFHVVTLILLFLLLVHIHDVLDIYLFSISIVIVLLVGFIMSKN